MPEQSGEIPKKFQIHPQGGKTFRVHPEGAQPESAGKKKFVVQSETSPSGAQRWFKQQNENDCGPCLILNTLPRLDPGYTPTGITEVRTAINGMRRERRQQELPANSNITCEDLGRYLAQAGKLNVVEFPVFPQEAQEVLQAVNTNLNERPFDLIYTTVGRHFRGVLPIAGEPNRYLLLDSLMDAPQQIMEDEMRLLLTRSAVSGLENRIERIGVVRRSDAPQYTVKN